MVTIAILTMAIGLKMSLLALVQSRDAAWQKRQQS